MHESPESQEDHDEDPDYDEGCDVELEFTCSSAVPKCILINQRCDGIEQCTDGSDEDDCGKTLGIGRSAFLCLFFLEKFFDDFSVASVVS